MDPANTEGFDNSGESLVMSPELFNKYLQAARQVSEHLVLKPDGFDFAPYPMLAATDRDRYSIQRILDFYTRQPTDYAAYFEAAWRYRHRAALGKPAATLADVAAESKISAKYLSLIWEILRGADGAGQTRGGTGGEAPGDVAAHYPRRRPTSPMSFARNARRCEISPCGSAATPPCSSRRRWSAACLLLRSRC